jgi:hypothetical protein
MYYSCVFQCAKLRNQCQFQLQYQLQCQLQLLLLEFVVIHQHFFIDFIR